MSVIGLIDDQYLMCTALSGTLEKHFSGIRFLAAANLNDFTQQHHKVQPAMLVIGNNYPDKKKGLLLIKEIQIAYPGALIVVYDQNPNKMIIRYIKIGVRGYILKANPVSELIHCIDVVLKGDWHFCPILRGELVAHILDSPKQSYKRTLPDGLPFPPPFVSPQTD